jgi:general secretion pathway protein E
MELGVPSYLLNATVIGVLAQRLVRTLCKQCRAPDGARAAALEAWSSPGRSAALAALPPVGCVDCRMTGFLGRMGLYELLTVSEAFKEKVRRTSSPSAPGIADACGAALAGALRVAEGPDTSRNAQPRRR